jgi:hypothetical protein
VFGSYNFFVALERNVEVIEEWTTEEVMVWMKNIGFGDFIKIARTEKIDGRKLKNIERKYMENVLGINKLNMQQKFMLCIEEVVEGKNEYEQLWVWGKNDYGQLGVSHANYVSPSNVDRPAASHKDGLFEGQRQSRYGLLWMVSNVYQDTQG